MIKTLAVLGEEWGCPGTLGTPVRTLMICINYSIGYYAFLFPKSKVHYV